MILVLNPGSSSIKYKLFDTSLAVVAKEDIVLGDTLNSFEAVIKKILEDLKDRISEIEKIGIRVVHGGPNFNEVSPVSDEVISDIKKYSALAPLHNPASLATISALLEKFDQDKLFAIFDTGFFNDLPKESKVYPLSPVETSLKIQRYGFHGISHKYMTKTADPDNNKKIITIHLGAGCSVSAINKGKVIATSMGLTPDEGLVMQTRSGDLDPGLILYLASEFGLAETKKLIETKSGLSGMTDTDGNMLDILTLAGEEIVGVEHICKYEKTDDNKQKAQLALTIYTNKIIQYIGGYAALLGGLDTIVFSGKIGAGSPVVREKVLASLGFLGQFEAKIVEPDEELAMAKEINKL